jgi:hypothetical protein
MKTITNFRDFLIKLYYHYKYGEIIFTKDDRKVGERRYICNKCPEQQNTIMGKRCNQCGCFINLKTQIDFESCPLDKW